MFYGWADVRCGVVANSKLGNQENLLTCIHPELTLVVLLFCLKTSCCWLTWHAGQLEGYFGADRQRRCRPWFRMSENPRAYGVPAVHHSAHGVGLHMYRSVVLHVHRSGHRGCTPCACWAKIHFCLGPSSHPPSSYHCCCCRHYHPHPIHPILVGG